MSRIPISDFTDHRLAPYCNLRERTLRGESIFIAEGKLVVERLLRSPYEVESILTAEENLQNREIFDLVDEKIPVFVADRKIMIDQIVGFEFYQGILALGKRPCLKTFFDGMDTWKKTDRSRQGSAWVVLPDATKPDNLGLAFRAAAALDAAGVVLGESCCDPFSRRALRVSMGGILQLPIWCADHLFDEMKEIRKEYSLPFYATVLDPDSVLLPDIDRWPNEAAFLFGNEYSGLSRDLIDFCDKKIIIPIRPDVDSLNLGVSVGIFLYEFNRRRIHDRSSDGNRT
ncbi:MAG: RNA methyltransferase [Planctomycetia bacterium]|nr:RNA methyltransferase [Planctomycetia bacterium]